MLRITSLLFALLVSWSACAQVPLTGAGKGAPGGVATYQGPGDVVSGATAWGSCARVYNISLASTSTLLCDLVSSSAPTVVLCTLRGSSTGFVDLSAYCAGALTPAATCAAATGGTCNISKRYDQIGSTAGWAQATAASQPKLSFSALNSLPGMTCTNAGASQLNSTSNSLSQPLTVSSVSKRTGSTASITGILGSNSGGSNMTAGYAASVNNAVQDGGGSITAAATDAAFHAFQSVFNGTSPASFLVVDAAAGVTGSQSVTITNGTRLCRSGGGNSLDGTEMETGYWPSAFTPTQANNMYLNQRNAYGNAF